MVTLGELAELVGGTLKGDAATKVAGYCSIDRPRPGCIAYLERAKDAVKLAGQDFAALLTTDALAHFHPQAIVVAQPRLAFIDIVEKLSAPEPARPGGVHPSASVHPDAQVDPTARVEAAAVVEAGAVLGPRSCVGAGAWIGAEVVIGADSVIGPNCSVYRESRIGDRVRLGAGTVIGAPGFGFVPTKAGHRRIPQMGRVVLEDDVELGSNCCVDRAALDDTVIHRGTKVDNLVQLAHGVQVGEHTVIAAQTGISGGTEIGKWCVIGGQAGFQGHISVGDQSIVAAQSGVFSDLPFKSKVSGYPAKPHAQSLKVLALTFKLPELLDKLRSLEIELEMLRGQVQSLRDGRRSAPDLPIPPAGEA